MNLNLNLILVTGFIVYYIEDKSFWAITLFSILNVTSISIASLCTPIPKESTRIDGKVIKIRNGIAKGVCSYYQNYIKTTRIQPELRHPASFPESNNNQGKCSFIKWDKFCEKTNSAGCSKFKCIIHQAGDLRKSRKSSRILGGTATKPHEFPHMALIFWIRFNRYQCGGTIIDANTIVTAANCLSYASVDEFVVYAGKHNLSKQESSEQKRVIKTITIHEGYKPNQYSMNDIALIELEHPLNWTSEVQPALLPSPEWVPTPNYLLIGWGGDEQHIDNVPSKVTVQIVPLEECRQAFASVLVIPLRDTAFCAGQIGEVGKGACIDDSGGPLGFLLTNGSFVLVGIVSNIDSCGIAEIPDVYTDVSKYIGWIHHNIKRKPNAA